MKKINPKCSKCGFVTRYSVIYDCFYCVNCKSWIDKDGIPLMIRDLLSLKHDKYNLVKREKYES